MKSKKLAKLITLCFFVLFLILNIQSHATNNGLTKFIIPVAFAHILATDGSVGAVLHIDPEDDPYVGQSATFFFEFKEKQGNFSLDNCDCKVSILEAGREIYSGVLLPSSTDSKSSLSFSFTFPQKDVYQVKVIGKPVGGATFGAFSLNYDVRVSRVVTQDFKSSIVQSPHFGHYVAGAIILVFFALFKKRREVRVK